MQGYKRLRGKTWYFEIFLGTDPQTKEPIKKYDTLPPGPDGKARSENDADKFLRKFIERYDRNTANDKMTVGEYLDRWIERYVEGGKLAAKTVQWYKMNVRLYLKPFFGYILLDKLTPLVIYETLQDIAAETQNDEVSIDGIHRTLRAALNRAVGSLIDVNPACAKVSKPPVPTSEELKARRTVLTAEEAMLFLYVAKERWAKATPFYEYQRHVEYAVFTTALHTAMRKGEILGLTWANVNLEEKTIQVTQKLTENKEIEKKVKTQSSKRNIRMTNILVDVLKALKAHQNAVRLAAPEGLWQDLDLVFSKGDGTPMEPLGITKYILKTCLKLAGLSEIRFHDLRHSTATLLLKLHVPITIISEILGHDDPAFTKIVYTHPDVQFQDDSMEMLNSEYEKMLAEIDKKRQDILKQMEENRIKMLKGKSAV